MEVSALVHHTPLGTLRPGRISSIRAAPEHIGHPGYMFHSRSECVTASEIKSPETIAKIREAGCTAVGAVGAVGAVTALGVTIEEPNRTGHEFIIVHDAYSSCLDHMGFPKSIRISINEVICHDIPDGRPLEDGDITNIDITVYRDGVYGGICAMFEIGAVDEGSRLFIERTKDAMMRGIKAVGPGREINVIGRVIEAYARRFDYGAVHDYTGHGVGEALHSSLIIPHYDAAPAYDTAMGSGMVFTIEPMLTLGTIEWEQWDDNWTTVTADHSRMAQFEYTIVIMEDGVEVLTFP